MEKVEPKAFENLKLVVELDFSWNKLKFVPLPQMRQLSLLRRLTMRGNPIFSLDEITLSGGINRANITSSAGSNSDYTGKGTASSGGGGEEDEKLWDLDVDLEMEEKEGRSLEANNVTLRKKLARFYETYPKLARTLVRLRLRSESIENSVIIKGSGRNYSKSDISSGFGLNYLSDRDKVSQEQSFLEQSLFEDAREFEILRGLIEQADRGSTTVSLLDKIVPGNDDEEEEQLEVSPGNERQLDDNGSIEDGGEQQQQLREQTFGTYFAQLQELDFGQCKLSYIKWTSLSHLKQLKRLLLDGNHLR